MQCRSKTTTVCVVLLRGGGACSGSANGHEESLLKLSPHLVKNVSEDVLSIRPLLVRVVLGCIVCSSTAKHTGELAEEV